MYGLGYFYFSSNQELGDFSLNIVTMYFHLWSIIFSIGDDTFAKELFGVIVFLIFLFLHVLIYSSWIYIGDFINEEFKSEKPLTNKEMEDEILKKAKGKRFDEIE